MPHSTKILGLFLPQLADRINKEFWPGVQTTAWEHNARILIIEGGALGVTQEFERIYDQTNKEVIYHLINKNNIDGLILPHTLKNFEENSRFDDFCALFDDIPIVTAGFKHKDKPAVIATNRVGMYELVNHFIHKHGKRRIAFIKGSASQDDANERFKAYFEALHDNNIPFDQNLVYEGNFTKESGIQAVKDFVDIRKITFDSIISSNDEMVLGAMEELKKKDFHIPHDIAIAGFDNILDSNFTIPPLTTVTQPLFQLAAKATNILIDILDGKEVEPVTILRTPVVIRQSCGCFEYASKELKDIGHIIEGETEFNQLVIDKQEELLKHVVNFLPVSERAIIQKKIILLYHVLTENFSWEDKKNTVIFICHEILREETEAGRDINHWIKIYHITHDLLKKYFYKDNNDQFHLSIIIQKCLAISYEYMWRYNSLYYLEQMNEIRIKTVRINRKITSALDFETLYSLLDKYLRRVGILNCFIVFFDTNTIGSKLIDFTPPEFSRLVYILNPAENMNKRPNIIFNTDELLPNNSIKLLPLHSITNIMALHYKDEHFGYIVLNYKENIYTLHSYEEIVESISASIKGSVIFSNMTKSQKQLNHSEKVTTDRKLTADFTHELKKPLETINNFSIHLTQYTQKLNELIQTNKLLQNKKFAVEYSSIIRKIEQCSEYISSRGEEANTILRKIINQVYDKNE